jgi:hypothetical protein
MHKTREFRDSGLCLNLPGRRLVAPDFGRPVAGHRVRVAVPNGYTALGIAGTGAVRQVGKGGSPIARFARQDP